MPLHLLGKKSWNVYNPENVAKVRRDEADAQAREAEAERRLQEEDAEQRLATIRGSEHVPLGPLADAETERRESESGRIWKKRRLAGEDDTERDIRLARDEAAGIPPSRKPKSNAAPLFDRDGHIDLIPRQHEKATAKNKEAEEEAARKARSYEDQYTMRLSNATGTRSDSGKPWYGSSEPIALQGRDRILKDVWGNDDPRRREREQKRIDATDPLAAMKKGVKQLRQAEAHRKEWREQRERDLRGVEELVRSDRRHKRRGHGDVDSLDGFDLDNGYKEVEESGEESGEESQKGLTFAAKPLILH